MITAFWENGSKLKLTAHRKYFIRIFKIKCLKKFFLCAKIELAVKVS